MKYSKNYILLFSVAKIFTDHFYYFLYCWFHFLNFRFFTALEADIFREAKCRGRGNL